MRGVVINLDSRPDRMMEFAKNNFPFEVERFSAIALVCGSDGCTLSHLELINQQREFPVAIFEDDCQLLQPWNMVENAMNQLPEQWDALWLGATLTQPLQKYSENLFILKQAYTLHAVIYNSRTMIDFIQQNFHKDRSRNILDVFYFEEVFDRFKCFITYPIMATQFLSPSNARDIFDQWCIVDSYNKFVK